MENNGAATVCSRRIRWPRDTRFCLKQARFRAILGAMTAGALQPSSGRSVADNLAADLGPGLEFDKSLAALTSFGTGGPARFFYSARQRADLVRAVAAAKRNGLEYFLIGGGSNLLVSDDGYDGLVIRVEIGGLKLVGDDRIEAGAGENLAALVDFATAHSLSGLEFAAGIWGTVGGAIYGNAGAYGGEIGALVCGLTLVDHQGTVKQVDAGYCRFGYRDSFLKQSKEVIVDAYLRLLPGNPDEIRRRVDEIKAARKAKFPERGCAGCFFKNIPDPTQEHGKLAAGKLLEEVGAKGMSVGAARVFAGHANIIVNAGGATSKDIRLLADKLKEKVRQRFGINLQEEVVSLGRF